jgi:hypothetical protein
MVLPQNAKVEAPPNFLANLEAAYAFLKSKMLTPLKHE